MMKTLFFGCNLYWYPSLRGVPADFAFPEVEPMPTHTVLVVEDDAPIRALLEAVLHRSGKECDLATDGRVALTKLASRPYDVILLDLLLPDISGFEILRHLKRTQPTLLSRIIVITAAAESPVVDRHELDETWCVFRKPLDIDDLVSEIDDCAAQTASVRLQPGTHAARRKHQVR